MKRFLSLLAVGAVSVTLANSAEAQNRDFGARRFLMDDNAGGLVTLQTPAGPIGGSFTYTFPVFSGFPNADVVLSEGAQTINGAKTLTSNLTMNTAGLADLIISESAVTRAGNIAINPGAGMQLTTDGMITGPSAGHTLGTLATDATMLTVSGQAGGGAYELRVEGDVEITGLLALPGLTPGQVVFPNAMGQLDGEADLFWNETNNQMTLNGATGDVLSITGVPAAASGLNIAHGANTGITTTGAGTAFSGQGLITTTGALNADGNVDLGDGNDNITLNAGPANLVTVTGPTNINDAVGATTNIGNAAGATNLVGDVNINSGAAAVTEIGFAGGTNTVLGSTNVDGATTINDAGNFNTDINTNGSTGAVAIGNAASTGATINGGTTATLTSANTTTVSATGASGDVSVTAVDDATITGADVLINTTGTGNTTIGSLATGGNITIGSAGWLGVNTDEFDIDFATGSVAIGAAGSTAARYVAFGSSAESVLATVGAAGQFSAPSQPGDIVLRSIGGQVLIQSAAGNPAITVETDNDVDINQDLTVDGTTTHNNSVFIQTASSTYPGDASATALRAKMTTGAGWAGAGAFGGTTTTVIAGEFAGRAVLGGHNATLTTWAPLYINEGGNVRFGGATAPTSTVDITGSLANTGNVNLASAAASTTAVGNVAGFGDISLGNIGAGTGNITLNSSVTGNIVLNGVDNDATPTTMLTINGANEVRATTLTGTAEQGVVYTAGQYKLGSAAADGVNFNDFDEDRFVNIDAFNLNVTSNAGLLTPFQVTGGAAPTVSAVGSVFINDNAGTNTTTIGSGTTTGAVTVGNNTGVLTLNSGDAMLFNVAGVSSGRIGNVPANTSLGYSSLSAVTTGNGNSAFGHSALEDNTIADINTAVGSTALRNTTTAGWNVAVGARALETQSFSNGGVAWTSANVAVGVSSLLNNQPTSTATGVRNTAVGTFSLESNTIGVDNAVLGYNAGQAGTAITTGGQNTLVGSGAQVDNAAAQNRTALGYNAVAAADNSVQLGNNSVTLVNTTGNVTTTGGATITGTALINASGAGATTIGNAAGGDVTIAVDDNTTDLSLVGIIADAAPTQYLTLTAGNLVRTTTLSGTADEGVSWDGVNGQYELGAENNTGVPFTVDRFVNLAGNNLSITNNTPATFVDFDGATSTTTIAGTTNIDGTTTINDVGNFNTSINTNGSTGSVAIGNAATTGATINGGTTATLTSSNTTTVSATAAGGDVGISAVDAVTIGGASITSTATAANSMVGATANLESTTGNITINADGGLMDVDVTGDVLPTTDDVYDLGSFAERWRDVHVGPASLNIHAKIGDVGGYTAANSWAQGINPGAGGELTINANGGGNELTLSTAGALATAGGITATTGDIVSTAGNISATVGSVSAGTTVTAGTGITSTTGNITATAGGFVTGATTRIANNGDATLAITGVTDLTASGTTNLNGATNLGNGADVITINATADPDAVLSEAGLTTNTAAPTTFTISNTDGANVANLTVEGTGTFGSLGLTGDLDMNGNDINEVGTLNFNGAASNITNAGFDVDIAAPLTQSGAGQVTLSGNVDAQSGIDVTGANLTVGGTVFTVDVATGATHVGQNLDVDGTLDIDGTSNFDNTVTVTAGGANITGALTQQTGQVTLNGNVDATAGLDVTNADLTVGGAGTFSVDDATGNVLSIGTITADNGGVGQVALGTSGTNEIAANDGTVNTPSNFNSAGTGTFATGLTVTTGGANITGGAQVAGGVTISSGGLTVNAGGASIVGTLNMNTSAITGVTSYNGNGNITTTGALVNVGSNGTDGKLVLTDGSTNVTGTLQATGLTAPRIYELPDASGTISLGGITNGTLLNSTLHWDGTNWEENLNHTVTAAGAGDFNSTLNVDGALTVTTGGASITGGIDANSGNITETGNITPVADNVQTLGTAALRYAEVHVGPGSLHLASKNLDAGGYTLARDFEVGVNVAGNYQIGEAAGVANGMTLTPAGALTTAAGITATTGGADITGATAIDGGIIDLNVSSNFATNINTGTSTGAVNIGDVANTGNITIGSAGTLGVNTDFFDITAATGNPVIGAVGDGLNNAYEFASGALLGEPAGAGLYSTDAAAGDVVLRTDDAGQRLLLQAGFSGAGIIIEADNDVDVNQDLNVDGLSTFRALNPVAGTGTILLEPTGPMAAPNDYVNIVFSDPDNGTADVEIRYTDDAAASIRVMGGALEVGTVGAANFSVSSTGAVSGTFAKQVLLSASPQVIADANVTASSIIIATYKDVDADGLVSDIQIRSNAAGTFTIIHAGDIGTDVVNYIVIN